mmetsp:Transcript_20535/g.51304  ORF Transcript_20535/g.51304 Transcript_20535/m.51304 type:complete len:248 (-) Transcript_20535:1494-2237(-)
MATEWSHACLMSSLKSLPRIGRVFRASSAVPPSRRSLRRPAGSKSRGSPLRIARPSRDSFGRPAFRRPLQLLKPAETVLRPRRFARISLVSSGGQASQRPQSRRRLPLLAIALLGSSDELAFRPPQRHCRLAMAFQEHLSLVQLTLKQWTIAPWTREVRNEERRMPASPPSPLSRPLHACPSDGSAWARWRRRQRRPHRRRRLQRRQRRRLHLQRSSGGPSPSWLVLSAHPSSGSNARTGRVSAWAI